MTKRKLLVKKWIFYLIVFFGVMHYGRVFLYKDWDCIFRNLLGMTLGIVVGLLTSKIQIYYNEEIEMLEMKNEIKINEEKLNKFYESHYKNNINICKKHENQSEVNNDIKN